MQSTYHRSQLISTCRHLTCKLHSTNFTGNITKTTEKAIKLVLSSYTNTAVSQNTYRHPYGKYRCKLEAITHTFN